MKSRFLLTAFKIACIFDIAFDKVYLICVGDLFPKYLAKNLMWESKYFKMNPYLVTAIYKYSFYQTVRETSGFLKDFWLKGKNSIASMIALLCDFDISTVYKSFLLIPWVIACSVPPLHHAPFACQIWWQNKFHFVQLPAVFCDSEFSIIFVVPINDF